MSCPSCRFTGLTGIASCWERSRPPSTAAASTPRPPMAARTPVFPSCSGSPAESWPISARVFRHPPAQAVAASTASRAHAAHGVWQASQHHTSPSESTEVINPCDKADATYVTLADLLSAARDHPWTQRFSGVLATSVESVVRCQSDAGGKHLGGQARDDTYAGISEHARHAKICGGSSHFGLMAWTLRSTTSLSR